MAVNLSGRADAAVRWSNLLTHRTRQQGAPQDPPCSTDLPRTPRPPIAPVGFEDQEPLSFVDELVIMYDQNQPSGDVTIVGGREFLQP